MNNISLNNLSLYFTWQILDPWEYRRKRAVMTSQEKEDYDVRNVILLETLGNARLDESYDYILSHINSTNSPWIKRAGCHALRKYHHQHVSAREFFYDLYLLRLGLEHPIFLNRGECSNRLRHCLCCKILGSTSLYNKSTGILVW